MFQFLLMISLWCLSTLSTCVENKHKRYLVDSINIVHERQASATPLVTVLGIKASGVDAIQPRLEIRELERRPDVFNVFLLGLQRFQSLDQDNKLSYFQVAGIHGRPFTSWDGVQAYPSTKLGYCRHSSNVFATWHRPYLALVEEMVYLNARAVIADFSEGTFKQRMNDALDTFRLPYWDAAAVPVTGESSYPLCVQRKSIEVELPQGNTTTRKLIENPLHSYTFHPIPKDAFSDGPSKPDGDSLQDVRQFATLAAERWTIWNSTMRYPTTMTGIAESQDNLVASQLDANSKNQRQRIYQMLAMQTDYYNISNNRAHVGSGAVADSLESVHDTLHNTVGSGGHMSKTQYSSFDPMFWLLHANTDRLLAIWQSLNPESYVTNHSDPVATYMTPVNHWSDENTPLYPFHRNEAGDFWTSATAREHTIFGYTYPELMDLSNKTSLIRKVNALYGENATSQFSWDKSHNGSFSSQRQQHGAQSIHARYQYFANIRPLSGRLVSAYRAYVFLGDMTAARPASESAWQQMDDPGLVGFTGSQDTGDIVGAAMHDGSGGTGGVIALTNALEAKVREGRLAGMDQVAVASYLREKMTWRAEVVCLLGCCSCRCLGKTDGDRFMTRPRRVKRHLASSWRCCGPR
ncbi:common central domain of tyrosinase-domain-containing protein [Ampelomyces quisqualis]|uniref:tyrosinase n=1 Tax=Ampelomyces quisqualis TaxID=50730 RepID=A0A6A5QMV1_AMPQU|nr:common central domain of tyrosinase-domain-containing protein [Ampelomyces quisqualis]